MRVVLVVFLVTLSFLCQSQFSIDSLRLMHDLKILSADSMGGRRVGTDGNAMARTFIVERLNALGVSPYPSSTFLQPFPLTRSFGRQQGSVGTNVLAVIEGRKKETIVISAHYDHVGTANNQVYNGADDNASGTAALLALASYFKSHPPEHRIILAFFDAEESGLQGSSFFVNTLNLQDEKVILNINMDMISRNDKNELYACGTHHYPHLKKPLEKVKVPAGVTLRFGHDNPAYGRDDWTNQSDQFHFHVKRIPFIYFGVEDHPDYHKPTDDFERINPSFYLRSVETILACTLTFDRGL